MIDDKLFTNLKKYMVIFLKEYSDFLTIDQLESLKKFNFNDAIKVADTSNPFGDVKLGRIYFSRVSEELIKNIQNMPDYNSKRDILHNKNLASYLKYMCENGYKLSDYYNDMLMYFIFKMVIKNDCPFVWGLINQEVKYLSIKYNLKIVSLYAKEEAIVSRLTPFLKLNSCRKIIFMDSVSSFKYLNDNFGFRFAKVVFDVSEMINEKYDVVKNEEISNFQSFLDYTIKYDKLSYVDIYDYILDFEVENSLSI